MILKYNICDSTCFAIARNQIPRDLNFAFHTEYRTERKLRTERKFCAARFTSTLIKKKTHVLILKCVNQKRCELNYWFVDFCYCFIQQSCINNEWKWDFWHARCLIYQVEAILIHFSKPFYSKNNHKMQRKWPKI